MAKLLVSPPNRLHSLHRASSAANHIASSSPSKLRGSPYYSSSFLRSTLCSRRRKFLIAPLSSSSSISETDKGNGGVAVDAGKKGEFPKDEFQMVEFDWWRRFLVRIRMLFALPWERVRKGSVLSIKLKGTVCLSVSLYVYSF